MAKLKVPCKFCGHLFKQKGLGTHQARCKDNPERAKLVAAGPTKKLRRRKKRGLTANDRKIGQRMARGRSSKGVWRAEYVTNNLTEADRTFDLPMTQPVSILITKLAGNVEGWLRAQAEGHRLPFHNLAKIVAAHLVGQNP